MLALSKKQLAAIARQVATEAGRPNQAGAPRAKARRGAGGRLPRLGEPPVHAGWEFELTTAVQPRPKQRARTCMRGGRVRTFTPEETVAFEAAIRDAAAAEMARRRLEPLTGPLEVEFEFGFAGDAALWPTAARDGDLDNIEKAVQDALNRVAYPDDRFIVQKSSIKVCAAEPFVTVRLRRVH